MLNEVIKIDSYFSIKKDFCEIFQEEKKSKFIGSAFKINTEEDAKTILEEIRKKYNDATHNCYAYITLDGKIRRCSDDGEPQKTAGVPILDVIDKNGVVGCLIIVTRYYGGTLLGTGGLVKMYSSSAVLAINEAVISKYVPQCVYEVIIPYNLKPKIDNIFSNETFLVIDEQYTDNVSIKIQLLREKVERLNEIMQEISNGQITATMLEDNIMCPTTI